MPCEARPNRERFALGGVGESAGCAAPTTVARASRTRNRALDLLASNPEAFVIAGGQSLMPVLAFRLATPSLLVDLRRLPGLGNIAVGDDGLSLGALVSWRHIEDDQRLVAAHPLLHAAVVHIAHYQIRNRGTVGGSLAHADPAAELPGVAVTCEGEITVCGPAGSRTRRRFFHRAALDAPPAGRDRHRAASAEMAERPALGVPKICPA
jgi:CO/xanthine dehydrogenase FAD-binding subunit